MLFGSIESFIGMTQQINEAVPAGVFSHSDRDGNSTYVLLGVDAVNFAILYRLPHIFGNGTGTGYVRFRQQ